MNETKTIENEISICLTESSGFYRIGFCDGVEVAICKLESMLTLFNGYPQNKLTALDVKEFVENELDMLRGTLKSNDKSL